VAPLELLAGATWAQIVAADVAFTGAAELLKLGVEQVPAHARREAVI
jgi:hypothetical protein